MSPVKPTRAIGYVRVSRVGGRVGDSFVSPELQRQSIERVCAREGLTLIDTVEELDASGADAARPIWLKAIEQVERGEAEALVVWNLSRFSRSTGDALSAIERIEKGGGRLYSEEGNLGKLSRTILFAVAEDERDRAKAGFYSAQERAISQGIYIAAKIPFGYHRGPDRRLVPDPEAAPVVREVFERRISGESWTKLARWLLTVPGAPTTHKGARDLVANVAYLGHARGVAGLVNKSAHDPLVSRLTFDRANASRGISGRNGSLKGATLLQGFVTCGTCGQNLHVGWTQYKKGDKKIRETGFYCRNVACTDKAFCRSKPLDDEVAARIIGYMTWKTEERLKGTSLEGKGTMRIEGNDSRSEIAEAERALEEADYELNAWLDNIELMPIIGKEQWNAKAADLATMRNVAKADLEELRLQDTTQDTWMRLEDLWAEWTLESKREFLLKTLSDCILTPAHRRHIPVAERVIIRLYGSVVHDRWLVAPNKWYRSYPPDEGQELVDREEWDRQFIEMWERKSTDGSLDEMIAQAWKRYGK